MNRYQAICHNKYGSQIVHFEGHLAETKKIFQSQCHERQYDWGILVEENNGKIVDRFN